TAALPAGDPLYNFAGRALISRGLALPRAFDRDAQWGFDTSKRPPAERDGYRPPVKLGVLLPLSGSLATASRRCATACWPVTTPKPAAARNCASSTPPALPPAPMPPTTRR
ncbi:hypothetical protein XPR_3718, partial [Xanthomonas arboricola pv. pruni MAFF 301420]